MEINGGVVALLVVLVLAASYAVWKNMGDQRGDNRISTRNRGISGGRGDGYQDGDLS
ncbi:MAG TPA: hypothetical protein VFL59_05335 [Candidatus Nanopelagicales bacterium]|nr:hypothetical protein [Candidatus Nanopelagicales bacterium]